MKDKNIRISTITYNAAITALSRGARLNIKDGQEFNTDKQNLWIKALALLEEMKSKRIWPDVYTYSGIISTCASGGRFKEALDMIKVMQSGPPRVRPNKIAYTGAICKLFFMFIHLLHIDTRRVLKLFLLIIFESCVCPSW